MAPASTASGRPKPTRPAPSPRASASDKDLTKTLLQACGVPVPEGRLVDSPEDAWEAAEDIGVPVVVKPSDGNHGRGVSTELMTREEVEAAYAAGDR